MGVGGRVGGMGEAFLSNTTHARTYRQERRGAENPGGWVILADDLPPPLAVVLPLWYWPSANPSKTLQHGPSGLELRPKTYPELIRKTGQAPILEQCGGTFGGRRRG